MSNFVTPRVEVCYSCHRGSARPRVSEYRTATEVVVEALWVCPNCQNSFKRGVVSRTPVVTNGTKK